MNYNSLEYVKALVCETFQIQEKDFEIKPCFEKIPVLNDTGAKVDMDLISSTKEYYFGKIVKTANGISSLTATFSKSGVPSNVMSNAVMVLKDDDFYNYNDIIDCLFNRLYAASVSIGADLSIIIEGWKIRLLDRK
jgi:hypothetical protein